MARQQEKVLGTILVILSSFIPGALWANGGPARWTGPSPMGNIISIKPEGLELKKEDLSLRIIDGYSYEAHAVYHIDKKTNSAQSVHFIVPIVGPGNLWDDGSSESEKKKIDEDEWNKVSKKAQAVELKLEGKKFECKPIKNTVEISSDPIQLFPQTETDAKTPIANMGNDIQGWCIAEIKFPKKTGVLKLSLKYNGDLLFTDEGTSKSHFTYFDHRTLLYPMFPAHSWAAQDFTLKATLALGPFGADVVKVTPNAIASKGKLEWQLNKRDLVGVIQVKMKPTNLALNELASFSRNGPPYSRLKLRATSSNQLSKYPATLAVDGKPDTAWCFADKSGTPNAEITLRVDPSELKRLKSFRRSMRIIIARGYLKSKKVYEANGKLAAAELRACSGSRKRAFTKKDSQPLASFSSFRRSWMDDFDYRLDWIRLIGNTTPEHMEFLNTKKVNGTQKMDELPPETDLQEFFMTGCVKLRVLKTEPGPAGDTCISEIVPVLQ